MNTTESRIFNLSTEESCRHRQASVVERETQQLNEQSISPTKNTRGHTQKATFPVFSPQTDLQRKHAYNNNRTTRMRETRFVFLTASLQACHTVSLQSSRCSSRPAHQLRSQTSTQKHAVHPCSEVAVVALAEGLHSQEQSVVDTKWIDMDA